MQKEEERYDAAYARLNSAQREAVEAIEGPVMVIAGPGTGKTQLLSMRVANILQKTDTPPSGILALTFTESGARAMRERLRSLIGSRAHEIPIFTFHSLCADLIRRYPEQYPRLIGSTLAGDVEKIDIISSIIDTGSFEHIAPPGAPLFYVDALKGAISELKRETITPSALSEWCDREEARVKSADDLYHTKGRYQGRMKSAYERELTTIHRTRELGVVLERYQTHLRERKLHDYDDLIGETLDVFSRNEDFLRELQEQYLYILADEHQDVNASQNALLERLASFHDSPNLFVVGDEKQAIFRFQGASLANFLYFKRRYPEAKVIVLSSNYRSTQTILDSAHSLIGENGSSADLPRVPLQSNRDDAGKVDVRAFKTQEDELAWVSAEIESAISEGVDARQIAVLYRANQDAAPLSQALSRRGIAHVIESDLDVLEDPHIAQFLALVSAIESYGDDTPLAPVLYSGFLSIDPLDAHRIIVEANRSKTPIAAVLLDHALLSHAGVTSPSEAMAFGRHLKAWKTLATETPLPQLLDRIAIESGYTERLTLHPSAVEKLAKLRALFSIAESLASLDHSAGLSHFARHLAIMHEHRVRVNAKVHASTLNAVRLMTVHRSKGLEFDSVYVIGLVDGAWGSRRSPRYFRIPYGTDQLVPEEGDLEERRLLYVAMTRARQSLTLSYFDLRLDDKPAHQSRFIDEIDPSLITLNDMRTEKIDVPMVFSEPTPSPITDQEYIRELFLERGLTITAINNYLECPLQYFFVNLIRLPQAKNESAYFGTAMHTAIASGIESEGMSSKMQSAFDRMLSRAPLTEGAIRRLTERAKKALPGFLESRSDRFERGVKSEVKIIGSLELDFLPSPLRLSGAVDAIDMRKQEHVLVIDFKTGKVKTRGVIEGTAKAPRSGDYLRQLLFYKKLLADMEYAAANEGAIDFIEPTGKGEYKTETFALANDAIDALFSDVARVAEEIYEGSFMGKGCGKSDCTYCRLARRIQER